MLYTLIAAVEEPRWFRHRSMPRVLLTAFEPYDRWRENASWLALIELTKQLPAEPVLTTRRYPVDFQQLRQRLEAELASGYDYALHLGQAPGTSHVHLESIGLNVGGTASQAPEEYQELVPGGPIAYRSDLPLAAWSAKLRRAGIPARVSYHAGTYLCNALLYLTHHLAKTKRLPTRAAFIHVPLSPCQTVDQREPLASLPSSMAAEAVRLILEELRKA